MADNGDIWPTKIEKTCFCKGNTQKKSNCENESNKAGQIDARRSLEIDKFFLSWHNEYRWGGIKNEKWQNILSKCFLCFWRMVDWIRPIIKNWGKNSNL